MFMKKGMLEGKFKAMRDCKSYEDKTDEEIMEIASFETDRDFNAYRCDFIR